MTDSLRRDARNILHHSRIIGESDGRIQQHREFLQHPALGPVHFQQEVQKRLTNGIVGRHLNHHGTIGLADWLKTQVCQIIRAIQTCFGEDPGRCQTDLDLGNVLTWRYQKRNFRQELLIECRVQLDFPHT